MAESQNQKENTKTVDQIITETEQGLVKVLEDSGLNITVLELIVRNIYLQLQNLALQQRGITE